MLIWFQWPPYRFRLGHCKYFMVVIWFRCFFDRNFWHSQEGCLFIALSCFLFSQIDFSSQIFCSLPPSGASDALESKICPPMGIWPTFGWCFLMIWNTFKLIKYILSSKTLIFALYLVTLKTKYGMADFHFHFLNCFVLQGQI